MDRAASGKGFNCGHIAITELMDLTAGVTVSCALTGNIVHGLPTALCRAGGYDLSQWLVHSGWALAVPRSGKIYAQTERTAQKGKHGLSRGSCDLAFGKRLDRRRLPIDECLKKVF